MPRSYKSSKTDDVQHTRYHHCKLNREESNTITSEYVAPPLTNTISFSPLNTLFS